MQLPAPKTTLNRAIERAVLLGVAAAGTSLLTSVKWSPLVYFVLKTGLDWLNKNIPNA